MIARLLAAAATVALAAPALAQLVPDAGSQLRDAEKKPPALPAKPPPRLELEPPSRPPLKPQPEVRFTLRELRFSGNTAFPASALRWLLYDLPGREVGFAQLEEAAARVTRHYRERGYLVARAYLPQQEIRDGVVEIAVLEGRLGAVELNNRSRASDATILRHLRAATGAVITEEGVERKLLLVSELPGVGPTAAALRPGRSVGESELALSLGEARLATGSVELDNYGSYFAGEWRVAGELVLASPTGLGDDLSARFTHGMPGLDLLQLGYRVPLGGDGLRAGFSYSTLRYELGKDFAALGAHGRAESASATLAYPVLRRRASSVTVQGSYVHRTFADLIDNTATETRKSADVGIVALSGDWRDAFGGAGVNVWSLSVTGGELEIETPAARAIDQATLGTHGGYWKFNWTLMRAQKLDEAWSALFTFSGQRAFSNLDSSEKFALGGPYGVRAYPLGEAPGDQGILANVELRYDIAPAALQAIAFADAGAVKLSKDPLPAVAENERALSALGVGLNWTGRGFAARAALAWSWGDERATNGPDRRPRGWLQVLYRI